METFNDSTIGGDDSASGLYSKSDNFDIQTL